MYVRAGRPAFARPCVGVHKSAKTIIDADYADDLALLVNALTQDESRLFSLSKAASGIGRCVNLSSLSCKQNWDFFTLSEKSSEIHILGSKILSTESDANKKVMDYYW